MTKELLENERQNSRNIDERARRLLEEAEDAARCLEVSQTKEKEFADRCREQVCWLLTPAVRPCL
jgi:hypothetical protein